MTLIATYKLNKHSVYVSDFRLTTGANTNSPTQLDISNKFISFNNNFGLLLAGDVNLWQQVIPNIYNLLNSNNINFQDIINQSSFFVQELSMIVARIPNVEYSAAEAIGFYVDISNRTNIQFKLNLIPGQGCIITEIPFNSCCIIGSGKAIPNIEQYIENKLNHLPQDIVNDSFKLACAFRNEILHLLKECGPSSFSILGITPFMSISTLTNSYFRMHGENSDGESITHNTMRQHSSSFERDVNGNISLIDNLNNIRQQIFDVNTINTNINGSVFDPQALENGIDIPSMFPYNTKVYCLIQWVAENDLVYRAVEVITFFIFNGRKLCNPKRERIITLVINVGNSEVNKYTKEHNLYFTLTENDEVEFRRNINLNLYSHDWLSNYINNYNVLYS